MGVILWLNYDQLADQTGRNGNISQNPMFEKPEEQNYQIKRGSPCIDAGNPAAPKDPDSTRADIGAFYYDQSITDVSTDLGLTPEEYVLFQNYPNPFNPATTIKYSLPKAAHVQLRIYNLIGTTVRTLVDKYQSADTYIINWDGKDDKGIRASTGIYIIEQSGSFLLQERKNLLFYGVNSAWINVKDSDEAKIASRFKTQSRLG